MRLRVATLSLSPLLTSFLSALAIAASLSPALAFAADAAEPDLTRDTLSPVYDREQLPYTWAEIRAGELPLTPVHWERDATSPQIAVGMNPRPILWDEQTVRVWYGVRGPGKGIHYADFEAQQPNKLRGKPVGPVLVTGPAGSYDSDWLISPEVVRLSPTHWRLYYAAKTSGSSFFKQLWTLAAADSHDAGQTWKKYAANPILKTTDDEWESGAVGFCSVEKLADDSWRMWYLGTNETAIKQIGYATSKDGLAWTRHAKNPVLPVNPRLRWEAGAVAVPRVIRDGRLLKMWYCCYEKNNTYAVGCAESVDGVHWMRSPHNPVLQGAGSGWDSGMTAYPGVVRVGDRYLMYYCGNGYGNAGIGLAVATAPGGTLLYRTGATAEPDAHWTAWQPLADDTPEPSAKHLQLAARAPPAASSNPATPAANQQGAAGGRRLPLQRATYQKPTDTDEKPAGALDFSAGKLTDLAKDERGRLRLARRDEAYVREGEYLSAVRDLGAAGAHRVSWLDQWTAPQTWKKSDKNPIYGPNQSGDWDKWTNGVSIVRTPDNQRYRMYYCGRSGAGIGFAEASIDDPLTWKEHPNSPVLKPRADNWEGNLINQPRVVRVTDKHWRMYYTGWGLKAAGTPWAMGLAESFDSGLTWKRHGDDPLIERGDADSPDGAGVFVPHVLKVGDRWMMWYTATMLHPGKQHIHLCLATSDDGVQWTKHPGNPVVTDEFGDTQRLVISRCHVRHDHGVFRMWYSYAKPLYRIHYAESLDGAHWEQAPRQPVLGPSPAPAWDSQIVEYPEIDIVDGQWRLWFCGNGYGSVGFAEGVVETGVELFLRSGQTATPDESWSAWQEVERDQSRQTGRYVQVRARLWSKNPQLSPALNSTTIVPAK